MTIKGKVEGIISPSSTGENQVITLPFTTADAIYFKDGKTLQQKSDLGELGGNSNSPSGDNGHIPNKWRGKRIYTFGDSITAGGYPNTIADILGAFVTNKGSSGGTYSRDFDIITKTDLTYADAITLMTGHNSGPGTLTLENSGLLDVTDTSNYDSYPSNYYGGIGKVIEYVRKTYPNIKIYLLTLHYTKRGTTSKDCRRALYEIGEYYSVPVIDVYTNCGINKTNLDVYSSDGTHLDLADKKGNVLIGECVAYQMMYL